MRLLNRIVDMEISFHEKFTDCNNWEEQQEVRCEYKTKIAIYRKRLWSCKALIIVEK